MLLYCILQEISAQWQKLGFAIAYKSNIDELDLAAHPWPAGTADLISGSIGRPCPSSGIS